MNFFSEIKNVITDNVSMAIASAQADGALPQADKYAFSVEVPSVAAYGDYATNAAMAGARVFRKSPAEIARIIVDRLPAHRWIESASVAGAFINFKVSSAYLSDIVKTVIEEGADYGRSNYGAGKKVLVEFVSANPTGPMHIGNARGGACGDCLAAVCDAAGFDTAREFYVNDAGNQIEKFGLSLSLRYLQLYKDGIEMPEDSYHGDDIIAHAKAFAAIHGDKFVNAPEDELKKSIVDFALPLNVKGLEEDLRKYRITYDKWFFESELHKNGEVKKVIDILTEKGHTYTDDGAIWFKATEFGCEKDFVLVRSNGIPTYVVPDIAYHYNKLVTRGYDKAIDILGADHHGYVPRLKGALEALGVDSSRLDVVLMQMVRLVRDGETVKLSKRSGKAITLVTLLDDVPIDAARFFFNLREPNSHFDFDLDLSVSKNNQNPVYYVQYAHARICSILANLEGEKIDTVSPICADALCEDGEKALVRQMSMLTEEIERAATDYDVSRVTKFAIETATAFHSFYNGCRVKCDDKALMDSRIALVKAVKITIENVLALLKVDSPEKM